jgi:cobalt/nickel transport system ATP-binding protein
MSHHLVEAVKLGFRYPDGTPALSEVSFRITHGESVALVGANGAGKSTLLLLLTACLLPTEGRVQVGDWLVTRKTATEVRRAVGMVFQDPDDQLFMPTAFDDVAFGPRNLGLGPAEVEARTLEALRTVGAEHLRERPPYRLSGGEKRAVAIATVLSMSPQILVLDEPSTALDPRARRKLVGLLRGFAHTRIIATHDLDLVLDVCRRTLVLHDGRLVADGPTETVLRDPRVCELGGLETPLRLRGCPSCGATLWEGPPPAVHHAHDDDHHHHHGGADEHEHEHG